MEFWLHPFCYTMIMSETVIRNLVCYIVSGYNKYKY